jgi:hypothetical protein
MRVGATATTLSQSRVKPLEVTKFTQTKKSTASLLKCQDNVDFFYLCRWDSAQVVRSSRTNSKSVVLLECAETRVRDENVQKSGRVGIGSCTMTKPPSTWPWMSCSFWPKTQWWFCPPPPHTHQTSLLATSFSVLTDEAGIEEEAFSWCCRGSMKIAGGPWEHSHWRF